VKRAAEDDDPCQPFVKWAGGKRQLLPELLRHAPKKYRRYFEPFVGAGALFFALRPERAVLADVNERLVRTYRGVRDDVESVIALLGDYKKRHDEDFFYALRERDIDAGTDVEVAAWFIYLNKTGFNGLYRVNSKNRFNVPFGRYDDPKIVQTARLRACSAALRGVDVRLCDFEEAAGGASRGDFVYFDPPYVPLSKTSSFTSYTSTGFDEKAQRRLRDLARALKRRGVHVLLSNSSAPDVRALYAKGFETFEVSARRAVNSKTTGRGAITELVMK
jgi:DNA adenine methylase